MMNEKKLADVLEITSSRRIFACDYCEYGIPFFRGKEITEKYLGNDKISTELFISRKKFNDIKIKFGVPCDGDILLTSVGTLGSVYQVKKGDEFYFKDGNITWFKNFSDDINSKFVYYWLISRDTQNKLNKIAIGTTQKALTIVNLRNIIIKYPSLYEQNFIVHILETLDDKIKLNRRQNTTLEAMAQAIFKEWFVDFGPVRAKMEGRQPEGISREIADLFPDRLDDEGKPEGWEWKTLDSILELCYGKALKASERIPGKTPVYGSGGITGYHNQALVITPSIIVGRKGTIGSLYIEHRPFYPIDTVFYVKSDYSIFFCYFILKQQKLKDMNTDAAVPGLNRNNVYRLVFSMPSNIVIEKFDAYIQNIYKKIYHNYSEISILISLRDTLLPKLISGELRVPDAEKMVADIV